MQLFWLFLSLTLVCAILAFVTFWFDSFFVVFFAPVSVFLAITTLFVGLIWADADSNNEHLIEQYVVVQKAVESCTPETDFNTLNIVFAECQNIDRRIEKHRRLYTSSWRGKLYSEDVANLELLLPQFEYNVK